MLYPSQFETWWEIWSAFLHVLNPPTVQSHHPFTLVVLDPIEAYRHLFDAASLRAMRHLIVSAKMKGNPVVVTRWVRTRGDGDAVDLKGHWSFFVDGEDTSLMHEIASVLDECDTIVETKFTNAFSNEAFAKVVGKPSTMVICGCWTESCVVNTARAALDRDSRVIVSSDATAGHGVSAFVSKMIVQLYYGLVCRIIF